jgi:hypothetical protein
MRSFARTRLGNCLRKHRSLVRGRRQLVCFMVKYSNLLGSCSLGLVNKIYYVSLLLVFATIFIIRLTTASTAKRSFFPFLSGPRAWDNECGVCWNTRRRRNIVIPTHSFHHNSIEFVAAARRALFSLETNRERMKEKPKESFAIRHRLVSPSLCASLRFTRLLSRIKIF